MNKPIHVSDAEFDEKVLKSTTPVVVDFWAPWCQPCRMIAPVLENLAGEYADKVTIAKVNTDENSAWAMKYGVQGIPTLLFIKDGKIQDTVVGVTSIANIKAKMDILLKAPTGA